MYDVLYMAYRDGRSTARSWPAGSIGTRPASSRGPRHASATRAGMFLAGSEPRATGDVVLIVESGHAAA